MDGVQVKFSGFALHSGGGGRVVKVFKYYHNPVIVMVINDVMWDVRFLLPLCLILTISCLSISIWLLDLEHYLPVQVVIGFSYRSEENVYALPSLLLTEATG